MTDPHPGKAVLYPRSPTLPVSATLNQVLPSPEGRKSQRTKQPGKRGLRTEKGPGLKGSKIRG